MKTVYVTVAVKIPVGHNPQDVINEADYRFVYETSELETEIIDIADNWVRDGGAS